MGDGEHLSAWISALAALSSAGFAAIAWFSWRAQFQLSFPYIETDYEPLANAHLIRWIMGGQHADDWFVDRVKVKGGNAKLGSYQTLMRPNHGRARVGEVFNVASAILRPSSPLVIVGETQRAEILLSFVLRSKANRRLKRTIRSVIALAETEDEPANSAPQLFSGQVEVRF